MIISVIHGVFLEFKKEITNIILVQIITRKIWFATSVIAKKIFMIFKFRMLKISIETPLINSRGNFDCYATH